VGLLLRRLLRIYVLDIRCSRWKTG
jgi:hypothetical protein